MKQSCSPYREFSNGMSHTPCMQQNWVHSWLLVIGSQITSLTPDLSFDHNLCFRCPNGRCEIFLNIYVSIVFQWYKANEFQPLQSHSEDSGVHWDSNSQNGSSLGSVKVHSLSLLAFLGTCEVIPRPPS
jgi:hypothetical protein